MVYRQAELQPDLVLFVDDRLGDNDEVTFELIPQGFFSIRREAKDEYIKTPTSI